MFEMAPRPSQIATQIVTKTRMFAGLIDMEEQRKWIVRAEKIPVAMMVLFMSVQVIQVTVHAG